MTQMAMPKTATTTKTLKRIQFIVKLLGVLPGWTFHFSFFSHRDEGGITSYKGWTR